MYHHHKTTKKGLQRFNKVILIMEENINESLAVNKIKEEIKQLLLKYKYGNNIHEHGKQQNE